MTLDASTFTLAISTVLAGMFAVGVVGFALKKKS
jgi:preprotein translocase subunit Sss1